MGLPGESGKQGIMGTAGPKGDPGIKGQKGDMGPAGVPEPKESLVNRLQLQLFQFLL